MVSRSHALAAVLLLALCAASIVSAFTIQTRTHSPTPISFAQYAARRAAGEHPAPEQRRSAVALVEPSPNAVQVTFLHFNDLYELLPSGKIGGAARLSTLMRRLESFKGMEPNRTVSVLAGDLFSPSALSTVSVKGELFQGKQMVAVMNAFGLDIATLGNHETDIKEAEYRARMSESEFPWLCSNARNYDYPNLYRKGMVLDFEGPAWTNATQGFDSETQSIKIGIWGINYDSNNQAYQSYENFTTSLSIAREVVGELQDEGVDAVIALTHLPYWHDETLTQRVEGIDIVMGGHEHIAMSVVKPGLAPIYKADSNVHSAWVHDVFIDPSLPRGHAQRVVIQSALLAIDDSLPNDPALEEVVEAWVSEAFEGFKNQGFAPRAYLATPTQDLVGTNDAIFERDTLLTELFNLALLQEVSQYASNDYVVPSVDGTLFNSGAIRIDDTLVAHTPLTQYDGIRCSPYQNAVALVAMTGSLLERTLDASMSMRNSSQFLHTYPNITAVRAEAAGAAGASPAGFVYTINGAPITLTREYNIGILGFLLGGGFPYSFLKPMDNPDLRVLKWDTRKDVRRSLLNQIALRFPDSAPTPDDGGEGTRIIGLKVWQFVFVCIGLLVLLLLVAFLALRCVRTRKRQGSASAKGYDREGDIEWSPTSYTTTSSVTATDYKVL